MNPVKIMQGPPNQESQFWYCVHPSIPQPSFLTSNTFQNLTKNTCTSVLFSSV